MIWDQGPSVALGLGFFQNVCKTFQKGFTVLVVAEDLSSFDSPGHDVLQEAGGVKSWLAWHLYSHRVHRDHSRTGGRDRSTARLTLGVGLAVSAFPLSVPV